MKFSQLAKMKFKCPNCGIRRDIASWISRAAVALEEIKPATELSCFNCLREVHARDLKKA